MTRHGRPPPSLSFPGAGPYGGSVLPILQSVTPCYLIFAIQSRVLIGTRPDERPGDSQKTFLAWPLKKGVGAASWIVSAPFRRAKRDVQGVKWLANIEGQLAQIKISGYRVIAYCAYEDCVYLLNAFKKDAGEGPHTRKHEIDLIRKRLRDLHQERGGPGKRTLH